MNEMSLLIAVDTITDPSRKSGSIPIDISWVRPTDKVFKNI